MKRCLSFSMRWAAAVCVVAFSGCQKTEPAEQPIDAPHDRRNAGAERDVEQTRRSRRFRFIYDVTIGGLPAGAAARVWVPVAQTTPDQCVEIVDVRGPAAHRMTREPHFGNRLLFFEAEADEAGRIPVRVDYRVERFEVTPETSPPVAEAAERFLDRSALALPKGEVIRRLLPARPPSGSNRKRGRMLYDAVNSRLTYDKSVPGWGRGDVAWACTAGSGNCSDFHSVFIAACQDLEIPARFEIGFPVPRKQREGTVDGYHCWASFAHEGRWFTVDIAEADKHPQRRDEYFGNLPADRVRFTVGRDVILKPPQTGRPVNFLIYPYVEVAGAAAPVELEKRFRFEPLEEAVCERP